MISYLYSETVFYHKDGEYSIQDYDINVKKKEALISLKSMIYVFIDVIVAYYDDS